MSRIQEKSPLATPAVKYAPSEEINLNKELIRLLQVFQQNVFDANESLRQFSCKTEREEHQASDSKHNYMRAATLSSGSPLLALLPVGDIWQKAMPKLGEGVGNLLQVQSSVNNGTYDACRSAEQSAKQTQEKLSSLLAQAQQQVGQLIKS